MDPVPLAVHLRRNLGGGVRFPIHIQNLRLVQFGRGEFSFFHRDRSSFRGIVQFSEETAVSCRRYFRQFDRLLTVEEYYFVKYGICLARPHEALVFFTRIVDEKNEVESDALFPQELVAVE